MHKRSKHLWLKELEECYGTCTPREYAEWLWLNQVLAQYGTPSPNTVSISEDLATAPNDHVDHDSIPEEQDEADLDIPTPHSAEQDTPSLFEAQNDHHEVSDSSSSAPLSFTTYQTFRDLQRTPSLSNLEIGKLFKSVARQSRSLTKATIDLKKTLKTISPFSPFFQLKLTYPQFNRSHLLIIEDSSLSMLPWSKEMDHLIKANRFFNTFRHISKVTCNFDDLDDHLDDRLQQLNHRENQHLLVLIFSDALGRRVSEGLLTQDLHHLPNHSQLIWLHPSHPNLLRSTPMWNRSYRSTPTPLLKQTAPCPFYLSFNPEHLQYLSHFSPHGYLTQKSTQRVYDHLQNQQQFPLTGFVLPSSRPGVHNAVSSLADEDWETWTAEDQEDLKEELLHLHQVQPKLFFFLCLIAGLPGGQVSLDLLVALCTHVYPSSIPNFGKQEVAAILTSGYLKQMTSAHSASDLQIGFCSEHIQTVLVDLSSVRMREKISQFLIDYLLHHPPTPQSVGSEIYLLFKIETAQNEGKLYSLIPTIQSLSSLQKDLLEATIDIPKIELSPKRFRTWKKSAFAQYSDPPPSNIPHRLTSNQTSSLDTEKSETVDTEIVDTESQHSSPTTLYFLCEPQVSSAISKCLKQKYFKAQLTKGLVIVHVPRDQLQAARNYIPTLGNRPAHLGFIFGRRSSWLQSSRFSFAQLNSIFSLQLLPGLYRSDNQSIQSKYSAYLEHIILYAICTWHGLPSAKVKAGFLALEERLALHNIKLPHASHQGEQKQVLSRQSNTVNDAAILFIERHIDEVIEQDYWKKLFQAFIGKDELFKLIREHSPQHRSSGFKRSLKGLAGFAGFAGVAAAALFPAGPLIGAIVGSLTAIMGATVIEELSKEAEYSATLMSQSLVNHLSVNHGYINKSRYIAFIEHIETQFVTWAEHHILSVDETSFLVQKLIKHIVEQDLFFLLIHGLANPRRKVSQIINQKLQQSLKKHRQTLVIPNQNFSNSSSDSEATSNRLSSSFDPPKTSKQLPPNKPLEPPPLSSSQPLSPKAQRSQLIHKRSVESEKLILAILNQKAYQTDDEALTQLHSQLLPALSALASFSATEPFQAAPQPAYYDIIHDHYAINVHTFFRTPTSLKIRLKRLHLDVINQFLNDESLDRHRTHLPQYSSLSRLKKNIILPLRELYQTPANQLDTQPYLALNPYVRLIVVALLNLLPKTPSKHVYGILIHLSDDFERCYVHHAYNPDNQQRLIQLLKQINIKSSIGPRKGGRTIKLRLCLNHVWIGYLSISPLGEVQLSVTLDELHFIYTFLSAQPASDTSLKTSQTNFTDTKKITKTIVSADTHNPRVQRAKQKVNHGELYQKGDKVGDLGWVLTVLLGQGFMWSIWRAQNSRGQEGVIRIINNVFSEETQFVSRFQKEIAALDRVSHPSVIDVLDWGCDQQGAWYFVVPFIQGASLRSSLKNGALAETEVKELLEKVLAGLVACHNEGVIHRDLKPENIILKTDGTPILIDFGIAHQYDVDNGQPQTAKATSNYAPPEQVAGKQVDGTADLFALGLIVAECLGTQASEENWADLINELTHFSPAYRGTAESILEKFTKASKRYFSIVPGHEPKGPFSKVEICEQVLDDSENLHLWWQGESKWVKWDTVAEVKSLLEKKYHWSSPGDAPKGPSNAMEICEQVLDGSHNLHLWWMGESAWVKWDTVTEIKGLVDTRQQVTPSSWPTQVTLPPSLPKPKPKLKVGDRVSSTVDKVNFYERVITAPSGEKPFLMMETQVTQALYRAVTGQSPSYFTGDNLPVETVSWVDGIAFCNALSEKLGLNPAYKGTDHNCELISGANGFRLPFEAEWKYAAKGGQNFKYAGSDNLDEVGWYSKNSDNKTQPVAQLKANGYGLYDMSGNVEEWCADNNLNPGQNRSRAPLRVFRGGSWINLAEYCGLSNRDFNLPNYRNNSLGLRLSRSLG